MASTIFGIVYILVAIYAAIFTFNNRYNMPCLVKGLNEDSYEVINKVKFNKTMIIQNTLSCMLFLLSGVLCITTDRPSAVALPGFYILIDIIFSKVAKKFITMK